MSLVYLDQNPYDKLIRAGITAQELSDAMSAGSRQLILSEDNFQEWASCWKNGSPEKEAVGRVLLSFALRIRPRRFLAPAHQLQIREIRALFGQNLPGPFLPSKDVASAEELLGRFADGRSTEADRERMLSHWEVKREASARAESLRRHGIADIRVCDATLDKFIAANSGAYQQTLRTYVEKAIGMRPSGSEFRLIRRKRQKCPALSAAVRADLFINWRIATGRVMQHDRWDDLRHCINATYADLFVTDDPDLHNAYAEIRPGPRIVTLAVFGETLGIPYTAP